MHSAAFFEKIFWIYDHNPSAQASGYSQYTNDWYVPEYLDEVLVTARTMFGKGSLQQKLINELPVKSVFIKKSKRSELFILLLSPLFCFVLFLSENYFLAERCLNVATVRQQQNP